MKRGGKGQTIQPPRSCFLHIEDFSGSGQHSLMHGYMSLSPIFNIEAGLYELDGAYLLTVKWHPRAPDDAEFAELKTVFWKALAPYHQKAMALAELSEGGGQ